MQKMELRRSQRAGRGKRACVETADMAPDASPCTPRAAGKGASAGGTARSGDGASGSGGPAHGASPDDQDSDYELPKEAEDDEEEEDDFFSMAGSDDEEVDVTRDHGAVDVKVVDVQYMAMGEDDEALLVELSEAVDRGAEEDQDEVRIVQQSLDGALTEELRLQALKDYRMIGKQSTRYVYQQRLKKYWAWVKPQGWNDGTQITPDRVIRFLNEQLKQHQVSCCSPCTGVPACCGPANNFVRNSVAALLRAGWPFGHQGLRGRPVQGISVPAARAGGPAVDNAAGQPYHPDATEGGCGEQ